MAFRQFTCFVPQCDECGAECDNGDFISCQANLSTCLALP